MDTREQILAKFNAMDLEDIQDSHLGGLISFSCVKRRRPRNQGDDNESSSEDDDQNRKNRDHSFTYSYKIRVGDKEIAVCSIAFQSLHGVTRARVRRIAEHLSYHGVSPKDARGHHTNHSKTPVVIKLIISNHIKSFKARQSHYSRRNNPDRQYLPETLSVREMHRMFLDMYKINVPYKLYWTIFHEDFNIKFGMPRSDTCVVCDTFESKLAATVDATANLILVTEKELHLRKAEAFYKKKRKYKQQARAGNVMCITFDYIQNLPLPHIPSGSVFYARQIWLYVFGIHDLSNDDAVMMVYDESQGKKGQNDVISLLLKYINNANITNPKLVLISDGCAGQNKNYLMVRFLYALVHFLNLFEEITYLFPVRGHSYMPNDQDFALIEKRKRLEIAEDPQDWIRIIEKSRYKPSPFKVEQVQRDDFFDVTNGLDAYFLKQCKPPMKIRDVRMLNVTTNSKYVRVRHAYSGPWLNISIRNSKKAPNAIDLGQLYDKNIELNPNKIKDALMLSHLLSDPRKKAFYEALKNDGVPNEPEEPQDVDISDSDNSSGCDE